MRVTFDTNALADVVSPDTSQRATGAAGGRRVRAAVQAGKIQGVFCETLITLEGIKRADRSDVFASTAPNTSYRHQTAPDGNGVTYIDMRVEQSARQPLDQRQADRFLAAFDLGMKLLAAPRLGRNGVDDPEGQRYVVEPNEEDVTRRSQRYYDLASAIEARGLGCAQAQRIARDIQTELGGHGSFLSYLGRPRNPPERKKIIRAVAEWCDGDSIAAHYGYGIDLFCSEDFGKNARETSVLDDDNRTWLTQAFGIQFVTLGQLAGMVAP